MSNFLQRLVEQAAGLAPKGPVNPSYQPYFPPEVTRLEKSGPAPATLRQPERPPAGTRKPGQESVSPEAQTAKLITPEEEAPAVTPGGPLFDVKADWPADPVTFSISEGSGAAAPKPLDQTINGLAPVTQDFEKAPAPLPKAQVREEVIETPVFRKMPI